MRRQKPCIDPTSTSTLGSSPARRKQFRNPRASRFTTRFKHDSTNHTKAQQDSMKSHQNFNKSEKVADMIAFLHKQPNEPETQAATSLPGIRQRRGTARLVSKPNQQANTGFTKLPIRCRQTAKLKKKIKFRPRATKI